MKNIYYFNLKGEKVIGCERNVEIGSRILFISSNYTKEKYN